MLRVTKGPIFVGAELGAPERRFGVTIKTDSGTVSYTARHTRPERVIAWMVTPAGELTTVPS